MVSRTFLCWDILRPSSIRIWKAVVFMSSSLPATNFLDPSRGLMLIQTVAALGPWWRPKAPRRSAPALPRGFSVLHHPRAASLNWKHLVRKYASWRHVSSTNRKESSSQHWPSLLGLVRAAAVRAGSSAQLALLQGGGWGPGGGGLALAESAFHW